MGPIARAGRKVSAPTSSTVPMSSSTKVTPSVWNVPAMAGMSFF